VTVNNLSCTDVKSVNARLAAALRGHIGDGQTDQVIVIATNGNDAVEIADSVHSRLVARDRLPAEL
jgi:hypothetical protein